MHDEIIRSYPEWDDRIEVAYVSVDAIKNFKTPESHSSHQSWRTAPLSRNGYPVANGLVPSAGERCHRLRCAASAIYSVHIY